VKGIKDPWRTEVEPAPPKTIPVRRDAKINLSEIDLDEDLRVPGVYEFECASGTIEVKDVRVSTPSAALDLLVSCCSVLWSKENPLPEGIVIWQGNVARKPTGVLISASPDYTHKCGIDFHGMKYDEGILRLIRWINAAKRTRASILKQFGVSTRQR